MLQLQVGLQVSLLWQSCLRGVLAGALRLDDVGLPTSESAVPYLVPKPKLQAGAVLHSLPDTARTRKESTATSPCQEL